MCDLKDDPKPCVCKSAVLNAYRGLTEEHKFPQAFALDAACIVYHHHHPEDSPNTARLKVESWINAGHLH